MGEGDCGGFEARGGSEVIKVETALGRLYAKLGGFKETFGREEDERSHCLAGGVREMGRCGERGGGTVF